MKQPEPTQGKKHNYWFIYYIIINTLILNKFSKCSNFKLFKSKKLNNKNCKLFFYLIFFTNLLKKE